MRFLPQSAKSQILSLMAAAFGLTLLVFVWITLVHVWDDTRQISASQMVLTKTVAHELDTKLAGAQRALEAVAGQVPSEILDVSDWLAGRMGIQAAFFDQGLFLFDAKGQRLGASNTEMDAALEQALEALFNRWVSLSLRLDEAVISIPIRLDRGHGKTGNALPMMLTLMVAPIHNERGDVTGALTGALDLNKPELLGRLARLSIEKTGYFFISAWDKTLILHPDTGLLMSREVLPVEVGLLEDASQGARGVVETRDQNGNGVLASLIKLQSTGWVLGGNLPTGEAYAGLYRGIVFLMIFIGLGFLTLMLVGWFLMRFIVNPLQGLSARFKSLDIHKEELSTINLSCKTREIQSLIESFNQLIERINNNVREMAFSAHIFEHAHEGILITDADQKIVKVNPSFCRTTGYLPQEVLGQSPNILSSGKHDYHFYQAMWRQIQRKGFWQGEVWNRHHNGRVYLESLRISVVRDSEGRITNFLGVFTDLSEISEAKSKLEILITKDPLTGILNRSSLVTLLEQAIERAAENQSLLAVVYIDLDDFKSINDDHGQATGDGLLIEVARRLQMVVRPQDALARLGGDEFIVLLTNPGSRDEARSRLEGIQSHIAMPYEIDGLHLDTSASIGVTLYPDDDSEAETLIRHAGQALYQVKTDGRGQIGFFDTAKNQELQNRGFVLERLREGMANNEMLLFYQPKVDLLSGQVVGAEALLRWQHPDQGLLTPPYFLEPFANHEVIIEIGNWVIVEALRQMSAWQQAGLTMPVSINLSARHLVYPGFTQALKAHLDRHPELWPQWLEIEILESDVLMDINHIQQAIKEAQAFGVSFALDDFGTGYSSLAYLKNIPANTLKIDRTFVRDMLVNKDDLAIVQGVIQLANVFHRQVVAEGVETSEHETALLSIGCSLAQGYGIARPMPAADLPLWVTAYELGKTHPMQIRARSIKAEAFSSHRETQ